MKICKSKLSQDCIKINSMKENATTVDIYLWFEGTPGKIPEETPAGILESTYGSISGGTSRGIPDRIPEAISEETSVRIPEGIMEKS